MNKRRLLVATTNKGKIREIKKYLTGLPLVALSLEDVGIRTSHRERGRTFRENARAKSVYYSRKSGVLTLAEDSGLEVDELGGRPGIFSARFSGRGSSDEKNLQKVLRLLRDVPPHRRKARFVSCLALTEEGRVVKEVSGRVRGLITAEKRGRFGFGYDPIFYYPPLGKNFAELPAAEKNKVSHRGRALTRLRNFLDRYLACLS